LFFIIINNYQFFRSFIIIAFAAVVYIAYKLLMNMNVEYEYIVTNSILDIDKIIARKKRKRICSIDVGNFDFFALANGEYGKNIQNPSVRKKINAWSGKADANPYYALFNYNGERTCLIFEPNEKMVDNFAQYISREKYHKF
ncbi:MAG: hypothetical protein IJQ50_07455, partial [Clostridia bacterium]|nr:hypothetical protein [Clostridia bacterium]